MVNEKSRLEDLKSYMILDSPPEKELDEIAEIASLFLDMPISLITMIDEDCQWFISKKGVTSEKTSRKDSICQHTLHKPNEVLVVNDSLEDSRFKDNPVIRDNPNIRFYAGAPLETPSGNVLGTLCVIDNKPREINNNQKKALHILAKRAMNYLNMRKNDLNQKIIIEENITKLKKLTNNIPGCIFELVRSPDGDLSFDYLSEGFKKLYPSLKKKKLESENTKFNFVHPEDQESFKQSMFDSIKNLSLWYFEYRSFPEDEKEWHRVKALPEEKDNGSVIIYGFLQDISGNIEYERALKQILFDISHVIRRPVTNLLGLVSLIENDDIDNAREYVEHIKSATEELEVYTRGLNEIYNEKSKNIIDYNNRCQ